MQSQGFASLWLLAALLAVVVALGGIYAVRHANPTLLMLPAFNAEGGKDLLSASSTLSTDTSATSTASTTGPDATSSTKGI